jgi:hypothetical protein
MQAISNNVRLQPIRPFTVQILNADKIIVGTGFVVDRQRKLVTCAHVIKQALGKHPRDCPPGQIINIYYPHIRDDDKKSRTAIIAAYFENQIDDVVLLELTEGQHPPEITPAVLGKSDQSEGNPFRAYGFPKLGRKESSTATGTILGPVISEYDHLLHAQLDELESQNVRPGMSGAAVLDVQRNLVVGLITSRWETEQPHETENVAWSTNAYV